MKEPSIESNKTLYEVGRTQIEDFLESLFENEEAKKKIILQFFGISVDLLSEEENQYFILYAKYALKRILNASMHRDKVMSPGVQLYLSQHQLNVNKLDGDFMTLFHDLAHTVVSYNENSSEKENSIIPEFLREREDPNKRKIYEEEALATVFMSTFEGVPPVSLSILDEQSKNIFVAFLRDNNFPDNYQASFNEVADMIDATPVDTLEKYFSLYQDIVYKLLEASNGEEHELVAELKSNPNPFLIEMLAFVYNNKSNPKVLYKLFSTICAPLLKNLQTREVNKNV